MKAMMISLPKIPYAHRIYMVLANPKYTYANVSPACVAATPNSDLIPVFFKVSMRDGIHACGFAQTCVFVSSCRLLFLIMILCFYVSSCRLLFLIMILCFCVSSCRLLFLILILCFYVSSWRLLFLNLILCFCVSSKISTVL